MLIDLSVPLDESTPVYPGDPHTVIKPAGQIDKDGFNDHFVSVGTHVGTHIDAPLHMLKDGKTLTSFAVDKFVGRAVCLKLENGQFDLNAVKNAGIKPDDRVLFMTGMAADYGHARYFEAYPDLPAEIADYLIEAKVSMVGFDSCGPDHVPFDIHKQLLLRDILIIENLTNLDKLPGNPFKLYALPIKLSLDGGPARVIAEI